MKNEASKTSDEVIGFSVDLASVRQNSENGPAVESATTTPAQDRPNDWAGDCSTINDSGSSVYSLSLRDTEADLDYLESHYQWTQQREMDGLIEPVPHSEQHTTGPTTTGSQKNHEDTNLSITQETSTSSVVSVETTDASVRPSPAKEDSSVSLAQLNLLTVSVASGKLDCFKTDSHQEEKRFTLPPEQPLDSSSLFELNRSIMSKEGDALVSSQSNDTEPEEWITGTSSREKARPRRPDQPWVCVNKGKCCLISVVAFLVLILVGSIMLMSTNNPPLLTGDQDTLGKAETYIPVAAPVAAPVLSPSAPPEESASKVAAPVLSSSAAPVEPPSSALFSFPAAFPAAFPVAVPIPAPVSVPVQAPVGTPVPAPTELLQLQSMVSVDADEFDNPETPYNRAFQFLLDEDFNTTNTKQRFAVSLLDKAVGGTFSIAQRDECLWYGVTCDENNTATAITWANFLLPGFIPADLAMLTGLTSLDLGENRLVGQIPDSIYSLSNLTDLFLHNNRLTGKISEEIGKLTSLRRLLLGENNLSGSIPQNLGSSSTGAAAVRPLDTISLYKNKLTGTIPSNLNLRRLLYLDLGHNQLSGSFPTDWVEGRNHMLRMRVLYLNNNNFTGSLPSTLGTLGNGRLQLLSIQNNSFTGEVPGFPMYRDLLNVLEIHNNNFTSMDKNNLCNQIVFNYGEMVMLRADCDICRCKYFCDDDWCYNPSGANSDDKKKKDLS